MQELETITIKNISHARALFLKKQRRIITKCVFAIKTAIYILTSKQGNTIARFVASRNLVTLAKHFGDGIQDIARNPITPTKNPRKEHEI